MTPLLEKHGRPLLSLLLAVSSLYLFHATIEITGFIHRSRIQISLANEPEMRDMLYHVSLASKGLAALSVVFAVFAWRQTHSLFAKITFVVALVTVLLAWGR